MNIEHIDLSQLDLSNGFSLPEDALPQGVEIDPAEMAQTFKGFIERLGLPIEDVILALPSNTFVSAIDGIVQGPSEITLDTAFIELSSAALLNVRSTIPSSGLTLGEAEGKFSGTIMVTPSALVHACLTLARKINSRGFAALREDEGESLRIDIGVALVFLVNRYAAEFAADIKFAMPFGVESLAMFTSMWDELAVDAMAEIPLFLHELCELSCELDELMESDPVRYGHLLGGDA